MTDDEKRKKIKEMLNDPEFITLSNIIGWAVQVEKNNLPLTLEEHLTLVNATMSFAKRIFPLYEKYQVKVGSETKQDPVGLLGTNPFCVPHFLFVRN